MTRLQRTDASSRIAYRPDIDGLRALAVGGVVIYHSGFGLSGGFVGVDVFFVISGFLITSLIINDLGLGVFTLRYFWERRIRRIFPPLLVMLGAATLLGHLVMLPEDFQSFGESLLAQMLMAANFHTWKDVGYFSLAADLRPLLHTWSLAVEEQFYFVFPPLFALLWRRTRRVVLVALGFAFSASLALSVFGTARAPSATFYLLPTRAWELLAGALLATSGLRIHDPRIREVLAWLGLVAIASSMIFYSKATPFPGLAAAIPVIGAALLILCNGEGSVVAKSLLTPRPVVYLGKISYALYLWHWPLLAFGRYVYDGEPPASIRAALCVTSILLSILSYHLVENPIRRKQAFASQKVLFAAAAITTLSGLAIGSFILLKEGFPKRLPAGLDTPFIIDERATIYDLKRGSLPVIGNRNRERAPRFIVWGDSHAGMFLDAIDEMARRRGIAGLNAAHGGNPPIPGVVISWNNDLPEWTFRIIQIIERQDIRHVILIARWSSYVEGATPYDQSQGTHFKAPLLHDGSANERSLERSRALFTEHLGQLLRRLVNSGRKVYIVAQVPELSYDPVRTRFVAERTLGFIDEKRPPLSLAEHASRQSYVASVLNTFRTDNVVVLSPISQLFDDSGNLISDLGSSPVYRDNQHLSAPGAIFVGKSIFAKLMDDIADENNQTDSQRVSSSR